MNNFERIANQFQRQKVPKSYFQSQFSMSKINGIFSKNNAFKNINLGDHFVENIFSNFNF